MLNQRTEVTPAGTRRLRGVLCVVSVLLACLSGARPAEAGKPPKFPVIDSFSASESTVCVGELVTFTVVAHDPDGYIALYEWNFQGGTAWIPGDSQVTWAFQKEKKYNVGLRITDDDGKKIVEHLKIAVDCDDPDDDCDDPDDDCDDPDDDCDDPDDDDDCEDPDNSPPTVSFTMDPAPAEVGESVTFAATVSDSDGAVTQVAWVFGDGETATGQVVTHVFNAPADAFVVTVAVEDDDSAIAVAQAPLQVTPSTPPADELQVADGGRYTLRVLPRTGRIEVFHD